MCRVGRYGSVVDGVSAYRLEDMGAIVLGTVQVVPGRLMMHTYTYYYDTYIIRVAAMYYIVVFCFSLAFSVVVPARHSQVLVECKFQISWYLLSTSSSIVLVSYTKYII